MYQSMLTVTYGKKMRASSHKECFEDLFMKQLSNRGYLGVSSRNSSKYTKDMDLVQVKVSNLDPNFYREKHDEADEFVLSGGAEHVEEIAMEGDPSFEIE